MATNFGKTFVGFGKGDFNFDNVVNALDFNILATQFGKHLATPGAMILASDSTPSITTPVAVAPPRGDLFSAMPVASGDLLNLI